LFDLDAASDCNYNLQYDDALLLFASRKQTRVEEQSTPSNSVRVNLPQPVEEQDEQQPVEVQDDKISEGFPFVLYIVVASELTRCLRRHATIREKYINRNS